MADRFSKSIRSKIMTSIRSKNNKTTEIRFVEILRKFKVRGWRRHLDLPGKPDFTFAQEKVIVFIDGCFWHGCPYCYKKPRTHEKYWSRKRLANKKRDISINKILIHLNWKIIRFWEHQLINEDKVILKLKKIIKRIR